MANILSNFEGWGPTEVAYKKTSVLRITNNIFIFKKYNINIKGLFPVLWGIELLVI